MRPRVRHARLLACLLVAAMMVPLLAMTSMAQPEPPAKDKVIYLQTSEEALNIGIITTRNFMNTTLGTNGQSVASGHQVVGRWLMFPEFAGDVHVNGTVRIRAWWQAAGAAPGSNVDWTLTLREIRSDGTAVAIQSQAVSQPGSTSFALGEGRVDNVNYVLALGSTLEAHLRLFGNIATTYTLAWGNATFDSHLLLPTQDYVRPVPQGEGGIWTLDSNGTMQRFFDPSAANTTLYVRASVTDPFGGYDIVEVNATVTAPTGEIVAALNDTPMTKVLGFFNTFENVYEVPWNYSGFPEGQYNITISALDNTGVTTDNRTGHLEVAEDGVFFIGAMGFVEVNIRVQDADGANLPGAAVDLLFGGVPEASGQTNASGMVAFVVPPGNYNAEVRWDETVVGSAAVSALADIPFDDPVVIDTAVFTVTLRVLDSQSSPLEDAAVSVTFPNGRTTIEPFITDAAGIVTLGTVAGGEFDVNVQWRGTQVVDVSLDVMRSGTHDIVASVYYVTFRALDSTSATVAGTLITVTDPQFGIVVESQITQADGTLTTRLPGGTYEVDAQLFGITVLSGSSLSVSGDASVDLPLAVYPLTITPVDFRGVPLDGAAVAISTTGFSVADNTGLEGSATFRLPAGTYALVVRWMNAEVFDGNVDVTGAASTMTVQADVHYLEVAARDRDGNVLSGVFVTVRRGDETVGAGRTEANGTIEFRLPGGTYSIRGELRRTEYLSDIRQTSETSADLPGPEATLTFAEFPPSVFTSALFLVMLAAIGLLALIAYVLLRSKRVSK